MSTPVERLRQWAHTARGNACTVYLPVVGDVEAVLAMLPPEPSVCAGHNPDGLTEERVGVKHGWRLLTPEEIKRQDSNNPIGDARDVHKWLSGGWDDADGIGWLGCEASATYRTKRPPGYFLPKPKVRVPLTAEDLPAPVCWITNGGGIHLVVSFGRDYINYVGGGVTFKGLAENGWQYSADRKTWLPCSKDAP